MIKNYLTYRLDEHSLPKHLLPGHSIHIYNKAIEDFQMSQEEKDFVVEETEAFQIHLWALFPYS
jgi:hypothetical protein